MARPDVTVMGAGILGLAAAWACAGRGARLRIVEARHPGAGASGGTVGALAPHVPDPWTPKKALQLRSLLMADSFWAEIAELSGQDPGHARTGRLQPLADAAALARARDRQAAAARHWGDAAVWRVIPAAEFGDWAPASPTGFVIHDTLTARIAPRRAVAALAAALAARGVAIEPGATPPDAAGPVIWATGVAGLAALPAAPGRPAGQAVKGQSALLRHDARDLPQIGAEGLHIVPHGDGTVAVGSTSENSFGSAAATDALLEGKIAEARALCPALADAPVVGRWAGLRPRARSRAPMLGPWPGRPGHFVLNGGFKIGFGLAPVLGEMAAGTVLEGAEPPDWMRVEASL